MEHSAFKPLMIRQSSLTRLGSMLNTAVGHSKKPDNSVAQLCGTGLFWLVRYMRENLIVDERHHGDDIFQYAGRPAKPPTL
ncbi:hypothetical protein OUZ56_004265 [Daphnia magna]|uniref:Uncharacterized protein n=1 Tax=Daphnia magna TaxID=35525 RepID=A0ABQ9YP85_9CRUS|nr:hypothetical protein OUZ56_004265 [Daphnia magna]